MIKTYNNLPVFNLKALSAKAGVSAVAMVDKPAIQLPYLTFSAEPVAHAFKVSDSERQIISGPALVPDTPIYRNMPPLGKHYVEFTREDVEHIAQRFFEENKQANANEMHDSAKMLPGMVVFESFISDPDRGISPMRGYEDTPVGTWFISYKVTDPQTWQRIKEGGFTGFSVEGFFDYKEPEETELSQLLDEVLDILNS